MDELVFLRKASFFCLLLLVLSLLINFFYVRFIMSERNEFRVLEEFESVKGGVDVVVLGDSHGAWALNPSFIGGGFNFAVPAENYDMIFFKARWVLEESDPSVFVLPVDVHSFSRYYGGCSDVSYCLRFMSFDELGFVTGRGVFDLLVSRWFPFLGRGQDFLVFFFGGGRTRIVMGWHMVNTSFRDVVDRGGVARNRVKEQFVNDSFDEVFFASFNRTLDLLRGKRVFLVKFPVTGEYLDELVRVGVDVDGLYERINRIIEGYDNVVLLDYQGFFVNLSFFADSDHLNSRGAEVLSRELEVVISE